MLRPVRGLLSTTLTILALCGLLVAGASAQIPDDPDTTINFTWSPSPDGSPAHHYTLQVLINSLDIETVYDIATASFDLPIFYGNKYLVRVAAVDALGRQGPYSGWSLPLNIEGFDKTDDPPPPGG